MTKKFYLELYRSHTLRKECPNKELCKKCGKPSHLGKRCGKNSKPSLGGACVQKGIEALNEVGASETGGRALRQ